MPRLVCLLPARNCAGHLDDYFASVGVFADAIVALDDGSTDGTKARLESEPLVEILLSEPVREGYAGWDDNRNRQRLLDATDGLSPDWLVWIDADERLARDDALALRRLVEEEALPDRAYGFRWIRMVDSDHYDRDLPWIMRLFPHRTGARLPPGRLHFVPVPTWIPRSHWTYTTIRIQHLNAVSEDERQRRYGKYLEADPHRLTQRSYSHILAPPVDKRRWLCRPTDLPLIQNGRLRSGYSRCSDRPRISALGADPQAPSQEVQWLSANGHNHPLAPALGQASAKFVWFSRAGTTEQEALAVADAHERGFALVDTVSVDRGSLWGRVGEAVGRGLAIPTSSGARHYVSNRHFSVAVGAIEHAGGIPDGLDGAGSYVLASRLLRAGYGVTRVEVAAATRPASILFESWLRGRAGAHILSDDRSPHERRISSRFLARYLVNFIPRRVLAILRASASKHSLSILTRIRLAPPVLVCVAGYWCGLWFELLRPGGAKRFR